MEMSEEKSNGQEREQKEKENAKKNYMNTKIKRIANEKIKENQKKCERNNAKDRGYRGEKKKT